jgi:hypothetical protein
MAETCPAENILGQRGRQDEIEDDVSGNVKRDVNGGFGAGADGVWGFGWPDWYLYGRLSGYANRSASSWRGGECLCNSERERIRRFDPGVRRGFGAECDADRDSDYTA